MVKIVQMYIDYLIKFINKVTFISGQSLSNKKVDQTDN
jgi:hypothetical protein